MRCQSDHLVIKSCTSNAKQYEEIPKKPKRSVVAGHSVWRGAWGNHWHCRGQHGWLSKGGRGLRQSAAGGGGKGGREAGGWRGAGPSPRGWGQSRGGVLGVGL